MNDHTTTPWRGRRVFVTGGSGFVGGAVVRRLVAEGATVTALARSDEAAAKVAALGAEPIRGDLAAVDAMAAGMNGADTVVHAAAQLGVWGDPADFERGNVAGTANVLDAARRAGVRRVVHVGTEAAVMDGRPLVRVDESAPLQPDAPVLYCATKARAEQIAVAGNGIGGVETAVVRPRLIWGPGDTSFLPWIAGAARSGDLALIGGARVLTDTCHVASVVEGILLAADRATPGAAYFLTDGAPLLLRDFIARLLETQGLALPDAEIPVWRAKATVAVGEPLHRLLRREGLPPIARFTLWFMANECTLDISRARRELGYAPVIDLEQGLAGLRAG